MNGIAAIIKKEFTRFFADPRMVFGILVLPALLLFVINAAAGKMFPGGGPLPEGDHALVFAVFPPAPVLAAAEDAGFVLVPVPPERRAAVMENIAGREAALLAVFPPDFEEAVDRRRFNGEGAAGSGSAFQRPLVELYYNSSRADSLAAFSRFRALLGDYEDSLANVFDVNAGGGYDLATDRDFTGSLLVSVVPFLMVIFMSTGALSLAVDAVAGEKERGTMTALLVTPLKRGELAAGKVLGTALLSFLSGLCLSAGTLIAVVSLPAASAPESGGPAFSLGVYGPGDYALFVPVLFSSVLLMVTVFSLTAVFAKTMREAGLFALPVNLLISFCAVFPMLKGGPVNPWHHYLIPFYNSVLCAG
ncbi:MAG: ABC transporter permease subunit, partial [Treponema sp.]|nr:ABC transporter permease subunit [Treponema sp.]